MFLKGLYTAMITPFDEKGKLDESGLRHNLRFQIKNGVDGVVLLGTTGEAPSLTSKEKERVIQIGAEEVKGKIKFIIGTGSYSTEQTIENTRQAKELGADAALVVTPYYNRPTQEGLFRHFEALSKSVDLPVIVYNVPTRTGQNMLTETLKRILFLPNVICVKETSGSLAQADEVIQSCAIHHPHASILTGDDGFTFPLMALGGHGVISVVSNLIPKKMSELVTACLEGDFQKGRLIHQELTPFFKVAFIETNPIPIKAAMHFSKIPSGACRLPLCDLLPENLSKLQNCLSNLPKEWFN